MASRPETPMPADVLEELTRCSLLDAYSGRPIYQRNDYLAWIGRAKRAQTRQKRLLQLLNELEAGGLYLGMRHNPSGQP
jgi:uncharacterized protein YdeI (YjbR/CyaY-like superfamily)